MVDIEEVKEITLEEIIKQIVDRLNRLEATLGYIIHALDIKPPPMINAEAGEHSEESSV
jgi:hypothetical protein